MYIYIFSTSDGCPGYIMTNSLLENDICLVSIFNDSSKEAPIRDIFPIYC